MTTLKPTRFTTRYGVNASDEGAALLAAKPGAVQAFIAENRAAWGASKG